MLVGFNIDCFDRVDIIENHEHEKCLCQNHISKRVVLVLW